MLLQMNGLNRLSNRKQYVSINGSDSNPTMLAFDVPQGAVLGPFLFLISINELTKPWNL